jgi:acyl-CoA thioesterase-1
MDFICHVLEFCVQIRMQPEMVSTNGAIKMADAQLKCDIPADLIRFERPLFHLARQLKAAGPVKVVAIGSSSTAGEGGIKPYPSRLEAAMQDRFHNPAIAVLNKGLGDQEALEEFVRFDTDVVAERPVVTIWQVGTNAIFHHERYDVADMAAAIDAGLRWLSGLPMDVILMDLQYAPAITCPKKIAAAERMVALIAEAAAKAGVNVFRRFALMRHWIKDLGIPIEQLIDPIDPQRLHQSEECTGFVTQALDALIADAVKRATPVPPTS